MTRVSWWGTGVVALVLLILCGGLVLVNAALGSGGRPLAPGTVLSAGTLRDGVRPVTFVVPSAGWLLSTPDTSLTSNVKLRSGDVTVNLNVVVPLGRLDAGRLWNGLGRIVEAGGRARLGAAPAPLMTPEGLIGLTGRLTGHDRTGSASVFATATLGATMTAAGPPHAYVRLAPEIEAMMRTVRIRSPWP
ncbi:hypothetical protein E1200_15450 [Actinomadura sp. GC306]|uniref:hypothetical protein n=1 Tax=Actinomadura sp. GC306 TaxID=2530367 RepID=UPI0010444228|nr:hypothetical protein [Actinomadura sp. GC306]TDC67177.1 hypothetical protein E1200_15450 [Actinomadura sp. GC306]